MILSAYKDIYKNIDLDLIDMRIHEISELLKEVESLEFEALDIHNSRIKESKNRDDIIKENREYKRVISTLAMIKAEYRLVELFIKELYHLYTVGDSIDIDSSSMESDSSSSEIKIKD